jgi:hypothetical protein
MASPFSTHGLLDMIHASPRSDILRGILKDPKIDDPQYFATPTFRGFGVITPLFSQSGQHWNDLNIDPMVREAPEYPQICGSRYFMTEKMIGV